MVHTMHLALQFRSDPSRSSKGTPEIAWPLVLAGYHAAARSVLAGINSARAQNEKPADNQQAGLSLSVGQLMGRFEWQDSGPNVC